MNKAKRNSLQQKKKSNLAPKPSPKSTQKRRFRTSKRQQANAPIKNGILQNHLPDLQLQKRQLDQNQLTLGSPQPFNQQFRHIHSKPLLRSSPLSGFFYNLTHAATAAPHLNLDLPPAPSSSWNSAITQLRPHANHAHILNLRLDDDLLGHANSPSWNPPWLPRKEKPELELPSIDYPYPDGSGTSLPRQGDIEIESGGSKGIVGRAAGSNSGIKRESEKGLPEPRPVPEIGIAIPVGLATSSV